jgi:hypothetical protein
MPFPLLIPLISAGIPLIIKLIQNNKREGETDDETLERLERERIERERLEKLEAERLDKIKKERNKKILIIIGIIFAVVISVYLVNKLI